MKRTPALEIMPVKFDSADDFRAALEARRPMWQAVDDLATREHAAAETAALKDWRERLKAAAKLTYAEATGLDEDGDPMFGRYNTKLAISQPSCPVLNVPQLDDVLARLDLTSQQSFTLTGDNAWSMAYRLLTDRPGVKRSPC